MVVIDASVLVADIRPEEPHHAEARTFLQRAASEGWAIYLPVIVLPEIAAAISRGTGDPILARRFVAAVQRIPHYDILPVLRDLSELAADLAAEYRIRGCDAVYVALAQQHGATLITLDRQQRERVPPSIVARSPAEALSELA